MAKETNILVIDIGGCNLKVAEFYYPPQGGIVLKDFAFRRMENDDDEQGIGFYQLYHEILNEKNFSAKQVRLCISGQSSFSRLSKLPPLRGNKKAIEKIIEYEARQTVPYAMSEVVWDYQLIRHAWEENVEETAEDGTVNVVKTPQEEFEALFFAIKNDLITKYSDIIEASGKEVISVEIASVALYNAAKGSVQCGDDECVLLLNIGGRGSNLMIADHNRVFSRSIPIAGDAVTNQVAKEYAISFNEAEELKQRHGFVALGGAYEEPESVVAATISKISRNVMTRLHGEVSRSINAWRATHGGNMPTRMLLSGGCSLMMYITDFFQEKLHIPVDYLNTFGTISIADTVHKDELQNVAPMFQELIGMSFHSVTRCPIDITLIPEVIRKQRVLDTKKIYFYLSAVSLILCLTIFSYGVHRRMAFDKKRVEKVQVHVNTTVQEAKKIQELSGKLNDAKNQYDSLKNILQERTQWSRILVELQRLLPDTMWLTVVEGTGPVTQQHTGGDSGGFAGFGEAPQQSAVVTVQKTEQARIDSINMSEITGLKLVGYQLVVRRNRKQEQKTELISAFIEQLKKSELFEIPPSSNEWGLRVSRDSANLTCFEIRVKLKQSIRK